MDWTALRAELPITKHWAFFDHAAVGPLSVRAQRVMAEWAADVVENAAVNHRQWKERIESARALAGQLLHCEALDIAFIKNTSEGVGIVAEGYPWKPGDNIVTAAEEYPANIYPWMNLAARGVEMRAVASRNSRLWIDGIVAAIDGHTRIVSLSFVEFASGFRNDLEAIGAICKERGISFFVDAIQGLGVLPLDVQAANIDFLAADGHKWLLGPEGAGILYVRRELVERLHPVDIGWNSVVNNLNFSTIDFQLKPHAGRWESGTLNFAGILGLGASLEMLMEIGIPAVGQQVLELTDYLCSRAGECGCEVYSSRQAADKSGIVSLVPGGRDPRSLVRQCRQVGIVINQRAGRLRVSPHCYNTTEEIDRLVDVLRQA
jgi:selenocysteine lyase/cysteine desulfurase